ncbi:MAG: hypothetical protein PHI63_05440 [Patescibacteria group bacterium]|nr:hypothetical protein [Patescibacteria group bacterium]
MMQQILRENIFKNGLVAFLLALFFPLIHNDLAHSIVRTDKVLAGNILVAVSIIAVTACFGNFAFTYEKIAVKSGAQRLLAHTTTGLLMLLIGISLMFTGILMAFIMGHFFIVDLTLTLLYATCVAYDFWDLFRIIN